MKRTVNKTETVEPSSDVMTAEIKTQEPSKVEVTRLLKLKEQNLFHRYLEANCDCV